jgi:predicted O-methyltransferase YrrM
MNRLVKTLLERVPFIKDLGEQVRKQGVYPAGHYHSPIPSEDDILGDLKFRKPPAAELPGVDLNSDYQFDVLNKYAEYCKDLPFSDEKTNGCRYYYNNQWFGYSDAIFLYCFLRAHMPKRIIEVGSGFSSAVMLDTIDCSYGRRPEITFIEPYPDRLNSFFRENDREHVRLINKRLQDVPLEEFLDLESGDFLFIDSSHVVKCGSDLKMLFFEIMPRLQPGVYVHFHDVFYPFEYPSEWLAEGRYWNENYFLRAFLSYNSEWKIHFFNSYVHHVFGEVIAKKMPLCTKNLGGSIYIQRTLHPLGS